MKTTLTIEVPDDFKKGQCWRCRLAQVDFDYDCLSCKVDKWVMHDAYDAYDCDPYQVISSNCPLEIQDDEQTVRFYYCEREDKYLIGQRVGNFYYAEFDGKYWTWRMSRYLPWGEDKYPSEPIELDFLTWFEGFKKKYIFKEHN